MTANAILYSISHPVIISVRSCRIFLKSTSNVSIRGEYVSGRQVAVKSVFALKIWSEKVLCQYNVNVTNITLIINLSIILITKKHENFF